MNKRERVARAISDKIKGDLIAVSYSIADAAIAAYEAALAEEEPSEAEVDLAIQAYFTGQGVMDERECFRAALRAARKARMG